MRSTDTVTHDSTSDMTHDAADSVHAGRMFTPSPNARDLWALPEEIDEAARRRRPQRRQQLRM